MAFGSVDGSLAVERFPVHVHHAAEQFRSDRHPQTASRIAHDGAPRHALRVGRGEAPHRPVAEVRMHLEPHLTLRRGEEGV